MSAPVSLTCCITHTLCDITVTGIPVNRQTVILQDIHFGITAVQNHGSVDGAEHAGMQKVAQAFSDFLDAKTHAFTDLRCWYTGYTDFQKKVSEAARTIPWGRTVSYKELASMSGYPKAIRAAASVMRNNRFLLIIPCHRVIRGDGSIGGFSGKNEGEMVMIKRRLLEREGVFL